jgi:hypothetical protein
VPETTDPVAVLRRARAEAIAISDKASGRALYRLLRDAEDDLAYRITRHKRLRPLGEGTFTREQMEITIRQIRDVMKLLVRRMGPQIADAAVDAAGAASEGVADYLTAAEAKFAGITTGLALDEAAMTDAAIAGTKASVVRRLMVEHPDGRGGGILQRYGFEVTRKFEKELSIAVVTKKPFDEVREALVEKSPFLQGAPRSWAERLTRTELHWAYNRGSHQAMQRAEADIGPMLRILVATFDNRTGPDSVNVHGQIRRMNEPFDYVNYDGDHESFMTPPNRPNDRETVVAHMARWPIPASFRPKSDGEVERAYKKAKQDYHGRPHPMSTVRLPLGK